MLQKPWWAKRLGQKAEQTDHGHIARFFSIEWNPCQLLLASCNIINTAPLFRHLLRHLMMTPGLWAASCWYCSLQQRGKCYPRSRKFISLLIIIVYMKSLVPKRNKSIFVYSRTKLFTCFIFPLYSSGSYRYGSLTISVCSVFEPNSSRFGTKLFTFWNQTLHAINFSIV
jgi:hypothetical protein